MLTSVQDWVGIVIAALWGIVTAGIAIAIFLYAFFRYVRGRKAEQIRNQRERAARVRHNLRLNVENTQALESLLIRGWPLINAASETIKSIYPKLVPEPTPQKLNAFLTDLNGFSASIAAEGWDKSSQSVVLDKARVKLIDSSQNLEGQLILVSMASRCFEDIIDASYSPKYLDSLLQSRIFLREFNELCNKEDDVFQLLNKLTVVLQRHSTRRFLNQYQEAVTYLKEFVEAASAEFMRWDDQRLLTAIEELPLYTIYNSATAFEDMKSLLKDIRSLITSEETYEMLLMLIDRIEIFLSRDAEAIYEPHRFQESSPTNPELIVTYTNGV